MPRDKQASAISLFKGGTPHHINGTVSTESTKLIFTAAAEMLLILNTDSSNILYVSFDDSSWFPIYSKCSLSLDEIGVAELYLKSDATFDSLCTYAILAAY